MKFTSVVLLLPVLFLASTSGLAQGFLHSSGGYIVDGNNDPFLLRGMGLGGWLVPEGYMIGTSSFANSPTAFKNVVTDLVGESNATQFFNRWRAKYVQRSDIDSLAKWGFNSVRLPMHYGLLSSTPGVYTEAGFVLIDSLLAWCEANHIYLILDMHCAPGGQNKDNISDYQGFPALWEDPLLQQWTAEIWKKLAQRYASSTWVGGYDLLNETAWTFSGGNAPLRQLLVRITDSIRTVDKNHLIFAEGNWYATDFSGLSPAWDNNMAWSFHKYWNSNDVSAIMGYLTLRGNTGIPLWLGESGENSNQWFSDAITLCELYNIGWSWWTLKKIESVSCPLSVSKSPWFDVLLKYWSGSGPKPSIADAMIGLMAQADLLSAGLCTPHPDFLNALFGTPSPNQRKPFTEHVIPGVIHAVQYDMGKNGTAYFDVDYQNTQGNGGPAYNSGWSFRNDGVDIEKCSDTGSIGYNVGWIGAGEFLAYTVRVTTTGTYNVSLRAAGSSGGTLKLVFDGVASGSLSVPNTGGWQTWQTVNLGTFQLNAGTRDMQLQFVTGGYNVNRLTFALVPSAVSAVQEIPTRFELAPVYPNPFNPRTNVGFRIAEFGLVRIAVCDLLGREVALLVNEKKEPGSYEVTFDASGLPSGVYVCRMTARTFSSCAKMVLTR